MASYDWLIHRVNPADLASDWSGWSCDPALTSKPGGGAVCRGNSGKEFLGEGVGRAWRRSAGCGRVAREAEQDARSLRLARTAGSGRRVPLCQTQGRAAESPAEKSTRCGVLRLAGTASVSANRSYPRVSGGETEAGGGAVTCASPASLIPAPTLLQLIHALARALPLG